MKDTRQSEMVPNILFGDPEHCTYCGAIPDTRDHVIPLSQYKLERRRGPQNNGVRTFSCHQCNMNLGDRYFPTFRDRCEYIQEKRTSEAHKYASKPVWDKDEMDELQYALRNHVIKEQAEADLAEFRANWQQSGLFHRCLRSLRSNPYLIKDHPKYTEWLCEFFDGYIER